jgi:hypothetical protein
MEPTKEQKIREIAAISKAMFDHFRLFVSEIMGYNNAQFHNELDDQLSNELNKKICIALPRGTGKTTHMSIAYPLWEIAKNHNLRILLVSSTAATAKNFMVEIINNIEGNPKYHFWARAIDQYKKGVIPKMRIRHRREEHWTDDSITIGRDGLKMKDPTIHTVGLFGSILSKRADIIIVDDVVTQENSATEDQRQKIKDWIYTTLMPVLVPGGRFIYLGNTWHMDDLVSNLLKDPQFDVRKRMPSIIHEAARQDLWEEWANINLDESLTVEEKRSQTNNFYSEHKEEMDKGIEVLWPERFTYTDLYMLRISNPFSFARMYQCDPSIHPNQKFTEHDIELALKKGENLVLQDAKREEYMAELTTSGLDLAISQKDSADDTVLLSLDKVKYGKGLIKAGDFVIRNIVRGKIAPKDVIEIVKNHDSNVRPSGIRVENNGYQESMCRDLGEHGLPIRSYHTGGEKNDPDVGINSLAIILSQGKLIFPYSGKDARTRQLVTKLVNEMRAYPDGHTGDSLMALWFAHSESRDYFSGKIIVPSIISRVEQSERTPEELNEETTKEQMLLDEAQRSGNWNKYYMFITIKKQKLKTKDVEEKMDPAQKLEKICERQVFQKMMRRY